MASSTPCQTPSGRYYFNILNNRIDIKIHLPESLSNKIIDGQLLENELHNVLELVIAKHYYMSKDNDKPIS